MEIYAPDEVAKQLDIKPATLRKYAILLENEGYKISRNNQNHRYYTDKDVMTLRRIIGGKSSTATLEEVIQHVVSTNKDNTTTNDTNKEIEPYNDDMKQIIEQQHEIIIQLVENQKKLIENEKVLSNKLVQHEEILEKLIEQVPAEVEEPKEEKQTFLQRIFNR